MKFLHKEDYAMDRRIWIIDGMVRLSPTVMVNPLAHPGKQKEKYVGKEIDHPPYLEVVMNPKFRTGWAG